MRHDVSNAHAILHALKLRGYSQSAIGARIGKSQAVISRWGERKGSPNISEYEALVRLSETLPPRAGLPSGAEQQADAGASGADGSRGLPEASGKVAGTSEVARISVPVDGTLLELADDLGLDLEALFAQVGTAAVRAEIKRLWQQQNRAAIEARNDYFEKHGLPLARYRSRR